jgi:hypothetical protein
VESLTGTGQVARNPSLPPSYVYFFSRPELMAAIPSCTACYWASGRPMASPLGDGGRLVRFLSDQQDVLHWYLWLRPDNDYRVVCGSYPYDGNDPYDEVPELTPELAARDLVEVAPSFEAFMWRFWIENVAWFQLETAGERQSDAVRSYLAALASSGRD